MRAHHLIPIFLIGTTLSLSAQQPPRPVSGQRIMQRIQRMADDALLGRKPMTPEFLSLQEWARNQFQSWGLTPGGENGTFFQQVPISGNRGRYAVSRGIPGLKVDGTVYHTRYGDFSLSPLSTPKQTVKGAALFAGYGISAPEQGLDEYAGLDVKGKIVLVLKGSPHSAKAPRPSFGSGPSVNTDTEDPWTDFSDDKSKIRTAYEKGAKAILIYDADQSDRFRRRTPKPMDFKRPFLVIDQISASVFHALMWTDLQESKRGFTRRMTGIRWAIRQLKPQSEQLKGKVEIKGFQSTDFYGEPDHRSTCRNVIAVMPGSDPILKDEAIVIGAHFDHVGISDGQVFNGADDNASGSGVVMEVAKVLAESGAQPRRTIFFCLWTGEELGLIGSTYWTNHPTLNFTMDQVVTNFNLDMVGLGDRIGAPGALNFPSIWEVIKTGQRPEIMDVVDASTGGAGGSDHAPFIRKGVEAMALMTRGGSGHPEYHDTGDDTEKLNPDILQKTAEFVATGAWNVAQAEQSLFIADRQKIYDIQQWRITAIRPDVDKRRGWKRIKAAEPRQLNNKLMAAAAKLKNSDTAKDPYARYRRRQNGSVTVGVHAEACHGNAGPALLAQALLNAKRFDILGDDLHWFNDTTMTENGRRALHALEDSSFAVHLYRPTPPSLSALLREAQRPVLVSQMDTLSNAPIDLLKANKALVAVPIDAADLAGTEARMHWFMDRLDREQLVFDLVSMEHWDDAKTKLYQALLDLGLTSEDILAMSGRGKSWRSRGRFDLFNQ